MICSLRKSDLCQCGCRGLCTLQAVMRLISWSMNCLASGTWPEVRHDGSPFEGWRADIGGTFLAEGRCGAVVEMRADLLEIIGALGFTQSWSDTSHPCFLCETPLANLYDFPVDMAHHDWPLRDLKKYNELAKSAVLIREVKTDEVLHELANKLQFDRRKTGGWGPGFLLFEPFDELDLPAGARLMESAELDDIHALRTLETHVHLHF